MFQTEVNSDQTVDLNCTVVQTQAIICQIRIGQFNPVDRMGLKVSRVTIQ